MNAQKVLFVVAAVLLATICPALAENYKPDPAYKPSRDLSNFFAKIDAGRKVTVMGIGGSVTEGHSWCAMAAEWLQKRYPNQVHFVNAAYGGTGPALTIFRLRRDVLPHHPDLVFIEYTVNAYGEKEENFLALDGIVQQLLRQWQKPDIVFVYVGNQKGERDLAKVQPVARHYGFLEVDPRTYLQTLIDGGKTRWGEIAGDQIHPNQRGHSIYAEPVIELLKQQIPLAGRPKPEPPVPPCYYSEQWTTATVLPVGAARFGPEWKAVEGLNGYLDEVLVTDRVGATMTVTAHTTTFGIYMLQTTDSGCLTWLIDGGKETELGLTSIWVRKGDYRMGNIIFRRDLAPGDHTLRLVVRPKGGAVQGQFHSHRRFLRDQPAAGAEVSVDRLRSLGSGLDWAVAKRMHARPNLTVRIAAGLYAAKPQNPTRPMIDGTAESGAGLAGQKKRPRR